jgi:hemerythrin superfamily protein
MAKEKKVAAQSSAGSRAGGNDATALLKRDHAEVKKLFKEYDKLAEREAEDDQRQALAEQICNLLTVHATIEEEIFYPAAREADVEDDLLDEAEVEHASAKDLIVQIRSMAPGDELYDAKVKVLGEYVGHHVEEEEDEMFPQCRESGMDLAALGDELAARKAELMAATPA